MKGYYLYEEKYAQKSGGFPGVAKKINDQIQVLCKDFTMEEIILKSKSNVIFKRLPFGSFVYRWDEAASMVENADFLYIRKPLIDAGFRVFLRRLKYKYPDIKVLLEIPTYPYDKEQFSLSPLRLPFFIREVNNRKKLNGLVDRIVTYSDDNEIFGIPTIKIQNGLDLSTIPVTKAIRGSDSAIKLVAVASLQAYHGYERIIIGLKNYYANNRNRPVIVVFVGKGPAEKELKNKVEELNLSDYISFPGMKTGSELTEVFDSADIGVGSFGMYKIGLDRASSLKTREYLARGLPVISGCTQDIFEIAPCDYHLEFPNDSSPVDIQHIVDFYDYLFSGRDKSAVVSDIRFYAEQNVTMEKSFSPVIEYLNG